MIGRKFVNISRTVGLMFHLSVRFYFIAVGGLCNVAYNHTNIINAKVRLSLCQCEYSLLLHAQTARPLSMKFSIELDHTLE